MWQYEIGEDDLIEELLGEDDEYLLGARRGFRRMLPGRGGPKRGGRSRGRGVARPRAMAQAIATKRADEGVIVQEKTVSKGRAAFMGLDSAANIAAAASATVTTRPQKLFRMERLAIPASIAPLFILTSLNVGTVNQFVANTAVPCETFQEGGVGVGLKGDSASPGIDISAGVTNISGGAARFRATIFGSYVE